MMCSTQGLLGMSSQKNKTWEDLLSVCSKLLKNYYDLINVILKYSMIEGLKFIKKKFIPRRVYLHTSTKKTQ